MVQDVVQSDGKQPPTKHKSPSQLRHHDRRRQEALAKAATKEIISNFNLLAEFL